MFSPKTSQEIVYGNCVKPLLQHVLNGRNSFVFAYGPTGSGGTLSVDIGLNHPAPSLQGGRVYDELFTNLRLWNFNLQKFDRVYNYIQVRHTPSWGIQTIPEWSQEPCPISSRWSHLSTMIRVATRLSAPTWRSTMRRCGIPYSILIFRWQCLGCGTVF